MRIEPNLLLKGGMLSNVTPVEALGVVDRSLWQKSHMNCEADGELLMIRIFSFRHALLPTEKLATGG
jgi:hypothetical protein